MSSVNWKWFVLLLVLGSGCKKSGILSSKNVKILGNFKVNFNLVAKDFKVTRQYHPDLVPFREKFLSLAADQGYHISSKAVSGLRKMIFTKQFSSGTPENVAAVCTTRVAKSKGLLNRKTFIWKEIQVKSGIEKKYGVGSKEFEVVVLHELFHCLMNREHYTKSIAVMNPMLNLGNKTFISNLESRYYPEMFLPNVVNSMPRRPSADEIKSYNFGPVSKALSGLIEK